MDSLDCARAHVGVRLFDPIESDLLILEFAKLRRPARARSVGPVTPAHAQDHCGSDLGAAAWSRTERQDAVRSILVET